MLRAGFITSLAVAAALAALLFCLAGCSPAPPVAPPVARIEPAPLPPKPAAPGEPAAALPKVRDPRFARLDAVVARESAAGNLPGAVVLVGHQDRIVYHKAFGQRCVEPRLQPMREDTVFDLASLTKVVATTTAIMQLNDRGRLGLDDPVARYWPEFAARGKGRITLRQLLTHTSGLRADINPRARWSTYQEALAVIAADRPLNPPGSTFRYSDVNFIVLGEVVHRVSGQPLDVYCTQKIFGPLGMKQTSFKPPKNWQPCVAPCDVQNGRLRWGEVQDPTAHRLGGVAGHAGVFSTAGDLAVFAQMLLDRGESRGRRLLSPGAVTAMTRPQPLPGSSIRRGLGWDIRSPYSKDFNASFPAGSFGHTGYTGTSIWVDPPSKTFLIILTNRLHPRGQGAVKSLRAKTAAAVAAAVPLGPPAGVAAQGSVSRDPGYGQSDGPERVRPGIEVLAASGFAPLAGKNLGVITNQTGVDAAGRSTLSRLLNAPGVKVRAIFCPEHGLSGRLDCKVSSGRDPATGLPVYSLYGDVKKPTARMLKGLDALVYDIQDVGARFYTYITTLAYAMEASAAQGLDFYVLDRPDPVTASLVQGPVLDPGLKSFVGYFPLPVRYGMTPGELAQIFNRENRLGVRLHVVRLEGYRREAWFDETGLPWINPSPNLRSLTQATLYCGVALVESANVSVGRGTPTPFEVVGAPWISGPRLTSYLTQRRIPGVAFEPAVFVPQENRFRGQKCQGVRLRLMDRAVLDGPALGVELAAALQRLYPGKFEIDRTLGMLGERQVLRAIKEGQDPREIQRRWQPGLKRFLQVRAKYLLY
jgi:uncharacterized protein YbbC (DUF1343 family)/CubicO group peptidase (beta-lactamase class C family)